MTDIIAITKIEHTKANEIYYFTYSDLSMGFWHAWYPSYYDDTGGTWYTHKNTSLSISIPIALDIKNPDNSIDRLYKLTILK
jgi:hypothetical protein